MVCKDEIDNFRFNIWLISNEYGAEGIDPDDLSEQNETESDDTSEEEDFIRRLPLCIQQRVESMKDLHRQQQSLEQQYFSERAELEKKYHYLMKPLFEKRHEIVVGNDESTIITSTSDDEEKGIPGFWKRAMRNMPGLSNLITDDDEECLQFLENISCQENAGGFKLYFTFQRENPFFLNKVLTKEYKVENFFGVENLLTGINGTVIRWKTDKCLTYVDDEKVNSFFNFFSPPQIQQSGEIEDGYEEEYVELFMHDYDLAHSIRTDIIPCAYCWYVNKGYGHKDLDDLCNFYIRKNLLI